MSKVRGPGRALKAREPSKLSGVGGHAPLENFGFSYALKCDFLHFEGSFSTKYYDEKQHNFSQSSIFSTISDQFPEAVVVALVYL